MGCGGSGDEEKKESEVKHHEPPKEDHKEEAPHFRIYGHGNDKYMADHVVAINEEGAEVTNGWKIIMWKGDGVGENADWIWEDSKLVSKKYPTHCIAVNETGPGVAGDKLVLWAKAETGKNATWSKKKHRMFSHREGGENQVFAVMEEGCEETKPNGYELCTWPRDDTGKNAKFHYKMEGGSSSDSD